MRELNYQLKELCKHNRDGSHATQRDRRSILQQAANDLHNIGFPHLQAKSLKPKHIDKLINHWKEQELEISTIKNRLSILRWWADKIGKPNIIAKNNAHYGIGNRTYVTNISKAQILDKQALNKITDPYIQISVRLQAAFGLRREEAIKFKPSYADQGDRIQLKDSWCKGSKPRTIPILNDEQRQVLNDAHKLVKGGSLIPPDKDYSDQRRIYEKQTDQAGLHELHGLRHQYVHDRYQDLTGREAPAAGGLLSKALTPEQKQQDREVRLLISKELGHERESITAIYLGR